MIVLKRVAESVLVASVGYMDQFSWFVVLWLVHAIVMVFDTGNHSKRK